MRISASTEDMQVLSDFEVGKVLGKGKFSQVYLVTAKQSGCKYAFKVLSKVDHRPKVMAKLRREIEILHALRDASIYIPCENVTITTRSHSHDPTIPSGYTRMTGHPNLVTLFQSFETTSSTILLLEYIAGINLHDFVFESIRLSEPIARGLFRQLVSAVSFCHARGVVHRDLKMGNVMLVLTRPPSLPDISSTNESHDSPSSSPPNWPRRLELTRSYRLRFRSSIVAELVGNNAYEMIKEPCSGRPWMDQEITEAGGWLVKLVDFGLGSSFDPQEYRHTAVGSPGYFAPEIALGAEYVGPEVDVWSCGVVLFEMTTGMHPFSAKDLPTLKEIVIRGRFAIPHHISPQLQRTFSRLMVVDASRRRNLHVLDQDSWTNQGYSKSPAYEDPPERDLMAVGALDNQTYLNGAVVMVDEPDCVNENQFPVHQTFSQRLKSALPSSIDNNMGTFMPMTRPRANTATANVSVPRKPVKLEEIDGPHDHDNTNIDMGDSIMTIDVSPLLDHRRQLARRLHQFNASVPSLRPKALLGTPPTLLDSLHHEVSGFSLDGPVSFRQQQQREQLLQQQQHPSRSKPGPRVVIHESITKGGSSAGGSITEETYAQVNSRSETALKTSTPSPPSTIPSSQTSQFPSTTIPIDRTITTQTKRGGNHEARIVRSRSAGRFVPKAVTTSPTKKYATDNDLHTATNTANTHVKFHVTPSDLAASMGVQLATAAAAHPALAEATVSLKSLMLDNRTTKPLPSHITAPLTIPNYTAYPPPPAPLRMRNRDKQSSTNNETGVESPSSKRTGWWPFSPTYIANLSSSNATLVLGPSSSSRRQYTTTTTSATTLYLSSNDMAVAAEPSSSSSSRRINKDQVSPRVEWPITSVSSTSTSQNQYTRNLTHTHSDTTSVNMLTPSNRNKPWFARLLGSVSSSINNKNLR